MKIVIVFAAFIAVTLAAGKDSSDYEHAEIVHYENDNIGVDGYKFAVETSDHKTHVEQGQLKKIDNEHEAIVVQGEYSYVDKEGHPYSVHYTADEHGFQAEGEHIPKA